MQNCRSKYLRRYALRDDQLTLSALLSKARALENRKKQAKGIEETLAATTIDDQLIVVVPFVETRCSVEIVAFNPTANHLVQRKDRRVGNATNRMITREFVVEVRNY